MVGERKARVRISTLAYKLGNSFIGELYLKTPATLPVPYLFVPYETDGRNVEFKTDRILTRRDGEEYPYNLQYHPHYGPFVNCILKKMEESWIEFFESLGEISDSRYVKRQLSDYTEKFKKGYNGGKIRSGRTRFDVLLGKGGSMGDVGWALCLPRTADDTDVDGGDGLRLLIESINHTIRIVDI